MLSKLRPRLTYANVVSTLCLFVVLGGTSYGFATGAIDSREIKNNSIRGKDIRTGTIRSSDVGNGSLLATDFRSGQLPAGERGETGAKGAPGTPATQLFGVINGGTGATKSGTGVVASTRTAAGKYTVTFNKNVRTCAVLATPSYLNTVTGDTYQFGSRATVQSAPLDAGTIIVETVSNAGAFADRSFSIAAFCPSDASAAG